MSFFSKSQMGCTLKITGMELTFDSKTFDSVGVSLPYFNINLPGGLEGNNKSEKTDQQRCPNCY